MTDGKANGAGEETKHFVLDTNVLLHNPDALFVFQDNHVIIPFPVIEELDKMKRRDDDIGRSARQEPERLGQAAGRLARRHGETHGRGAPGGRAQDHPEGVRPEMLEVGPKSAGAATPTHPSMGCAGNSILCTLLEGSRSRTVPF